MLKIQKTPNHGHDLWDVIYMLVISEASNDISSDVIDVIIVVLYSAVLQN